MPQGKVREPAILADKLQAIRDSVDIFNPDARMAARSAFDAAERVWKMVPEIIVALRTPNTPDSLGDEA